MSDAEWIALVALVVSIISGTIAYTAPRSRMKKTERPDNTDVLRDISDMSKQAEAEHPDMRLESDELKKLDEWRRGQLDLPSRAEAVRRLIDRNAAPKRQR